MLRYILLLIFLTLPVTQAEALSLKTAPVQASLLNQIYSQPAHLLWSNGSQLNQSGQDAIDFIGDCRQQGMDPENYNYSVLLELKSQLNANNEWQFDHLLTMSLLQLINDLKNGRFPPDKIDTAWTIQKPVFDAVDFLKQAMLGKHLKVTLNTLIPQSPGYQALVQLLSRYRDYVARGGWQPLTKVPLLKPGNSDAIVPALRQRLAFEDPEFDGLVHPNSKHYGEALVAAVRRFQTTHGLKVDGIVGKDTVAELNVSAAQRVQQIRINLERFRWLPDNLGNRYIMINLPTYQLIAVDHNQVKLDMRVIVGQLKRQTPSFSSELSHLVINPYWSVPTKLARVDLLPKQQADINYFYRNDIRVYENINGKKQEIEPYLVNWQLYNRHYLPFTFQQEPGPLNALGRIKFMFPNPWNIYLHDTPHKSLFSASQRNFSSGCIRVEHPLALAEFSLNEPEARQNLLKMIESGENLAQPISKPLPVYAVYFTVWTQGKQVRFGHDRYHRNKNFTNFL